MLGYLIGNLGVTVQYKNEYGVRFQKSGLCPRNPRESTSRTEMKFEIFFFIKIRFADLGVASGFARVRTMPDSDGCVLMTTLSFPVDHTCFFSILFSVHFMIPLPLSPHIR